MRPIDLKTLRIARDGLFLFGANMGPTYGSMRLPEFIGMTPGVVDKDFYDVYDEYYLLDPATELDEVDWHTASIQGKERFVLVDKKGVNVVLYGSMLDDDRLKRDVRIYQIKERE